MITTSGPDWRSQWSNFEHSNYL